MISLGNMNSSMLHLPRNTIITSTTKRETPSTDVGFNHRTQEVKTSLREHSWRNLVNTCAPLVAARRGGWTAGLGRRERALISVYLTVDLPNCQLPRTKPAYAGLYLGPFRSSGSEQIQLCKAAE